MHDDLTARLDPTHLAPDLPDSDEDLRKEVEAEVEPAKAAEARDASDLRNEERFSFRVDYVDARGEPWEGAFVTKILNVGERQQVGVLRSRFQGGAALESLDAYTADINSKVAHMMLSLVDKPKWAKDLRKLLDPGVLDAIYREVASHEAFFLGWLATSEEGATKS